jgi:hypothetical protein
MEEEEGPVINMGPQSHLILDAQVEQLGQSRLPSFRLPLQGIRKIKALDRRLNP